MSYYTIQDYRGEHDPDDTKRDFRTDADRYWEPPQEIEDDILELDEMTTAELIAEELKKMSILDFHQLAEGFAARSWTYQEFMDTWAAGNK